MKCPSRSECPKTPPSRREKDGSADSVWIICGLNSPRAGFVGPRRGVFSEWRLAARPSPYQLLLMDAARRKTGTHSVTAPPLLQTRTTSNLTVSMQGTQEGLANGALIPKEFSCDFCLLYCRFHIHISQRGGARLRRTYRNLTYLKRGLPVRPRFSWNSQDFKVVVERSRAQNLCREFIFNTLKRLDIFFKINLRPIIILCRTSSSALDSKFENSGCLFKKKQKNNTFFVQFTLDLNQWKSEIQWKSHWISVNVALLKKFSDAMLT